MTDPCLLMVYICGHKTGVFVDGKCDTIEIWHTYMDPLWAINGQCSIAMLNDRKVEAALQKTQVVAMHKRFAFSLSLEKKLVRSPIGLK